MTKGQFKTIAKICSERKIKYDGSGEMFIQRYLQRPIENGFSCPAVIWKKNYIKADKIKEGFEG
jgi:hypothetical protein